MRLTFIYTILALIATIANILTQDAAFRLYHGLHSVLLSVIAGTGVGLIIKYVLDKKYIFRFRALDASHDGRTFLLYTLMGLVTTFVFWGFEFGFHYLFKTKEMRYLGGSIGLVIGYLAKYHLDKQFVFCKSRKIDKK